jgi:hypothetical protein
MTPTDRPGWRFRPTSPADRAGLIAFFDALPEADRRLRFFGPSDVAGHVDRWLALEGAVSIVAVVDEPGGEPGCVPGCVPADGSGQAPGLEPRIVAEGGFVDRGEGMAEFALSVAYDARGGLGTAMFEQLRIAAAERGVPMLYGDVLASNLPMLGLMRRLGGVTIERPERQVIGIVVGTATGAPPWPDRPRPRLLIEATSASWSGEERLRAAGIDVAVCAGPSARRASAPCPELTGEGCPLVEGADLVVHLLDEDRPEHRHLAASLAARDEPERILLVGGGSERPDVAAIERRLDERGRGRHGSGRDGTGCC